MGRTIFIYLIICLCVFGIIPSSANISDDGDEEEEQSTPSLLKEIFVKAVPKNISDTTEALAVSVTPSNTLNDSNVISPRMALDKEHHKERRNSIPLYPHPRYIPLSPQYGIAAEDSCPPMAETCPACLTFSSQLPYDLCSYPIAIRVILISAPTTDYNGRVCGKLGLISSHGNTEEREFRKLLRFSQAESCGCIFKSSQHYLLISKETAFVKDGPLFTKVALSNEAFILPIDRYTEPEILRPLQVCSLKPPPIANKLKLDGKQHQQARTYLSAPPTPVYNQPPPTVHNTVPLPVKAPPPVYVPSPILPAHKTPVYNTPPPEHKPPLPVPQSYDSPPPFYGSLHPVVHTLPPTEYSPSYVVYHQYPPAAPPPYVTAALPPYVPPPLTYVPPPPPVYATPPPPPPYATPRFPPPYVSPPLQPYVSPPPPPYGTPPPQHVPPSTLPYAPPPPTPPPVLVVPPFPPILKQCLIPETCPKCAKIGEVDLAQEYCRSNFAYLAVITFPDRSQVSKGYHNTYGTCLSLQTHVIHDVSKGLDPKLLNLYLSLLLPLNCPCLPDMKGLGIVMILGYYADPLADRTFKQLTKDYAILFLPAPSEVSIPSCTFGYGLPVLPDYKPPHASLQPAAPPNCPVGVENSCPLCAGAIDDNFFKQFCAANVAFVAELLGAGPFTAAKPIPPAVEIKTTAINYYKTVVISVKKPPPPTCIEGSLKILQFIKFVPGPYAAESIIPFVALSECVCALLAAGPGTKLLVYSAKSLPYLPNGVIQLTKDIYIGPLGAYEKVPSCTKPEQPPYYSPATTTVAYVPPPPSPTYTSAAPVENKPPPSPPPAHKPAPVNTPTLPPVYKPTHASVYTPHPPAQVYTAAFPKPNYITPQPVTYKITPPPAYSPPTPPSPVKISPPRQQEYPATPTVYKPLHGSPVYVAPLTPDYAPAQTPVYTLPPTPPPVAYAPPPARAPPAEYDSCPESDHSCPDCAGALPTNFQDLYCLAEFAIIVAVGLDKNKLYRENEAIIVAVGLDKNKLYRENEVSRMIPFKLPPPLIIDIKGGLYTNQLNATVLPGNHVDVIAKQKAAAEYKCLKEKIKVLYDVTKGRAREYLADLDVYIPATCPDCPVFLNSPTYAIILSKKQTVLYNPLQLNSQFFFYPLPKGLLTLPPCPLPSYSPQPYPVIHSSAITYSVPLPPPGGLMACEYLHCKGCSVASPYSHITIPCDQKFAALVEVIATSAGKKGAPTIEITQYSNNYGAPVVTLDIKDAPPAPYPSGPLYNQGSSLCKFANVKVVKDLSPNSTPLPPGTILTVAAAENCNCHIFSVGQGFGILIAPVYYPDVTITIGPASTICLPIGLTTISSCSASPVPVPDNPPYVSQPTQYMPPHAPLPGKKVPPVTYAPPPPPYPSQPTQYMPPHASLPVTYVPPVTYAPPPPPPPVSYATPPALPLSPPSVPSPLVPPPATPEPSCEDFTHEFCPTCGASSAITPDVYCNSKIVFLIRGGRVVKSPDPRKGCTTGDVLTLYEVTASKPAQKAVLNIFFSFPNHCGCPSLDNDQFALLMIRNSIPITNPLHLPLNKDTHIYAVPAGKLTLPFCTPSELYPRTQDAEEIIVDSVENELTILRRKEQNLKTCPIRDNSCPKCDNVLSDEKLMKIVCSSDKALKVTHGAKKLARKQRVTVSQRPADNYTMDIWVKPFENTDICSLPVKPGEKCSSFSTRYYYDRDSQLCRKFQYSGCDGNANNFINLLDCEESCMRDGFCDEGHLQIEDVVRSASGEDEERMEKLKYAIAENCDCPALTEGDAFVVYNSSNLPDTVQLTEDFRIISLSESQQENSDWCRAPEITTNARTAATEAHTTTEDDNENNEPEDTDAKDDFDNEKDEDTDDANYDILGEKKIDDLDETTDDDDEANPIDEAYIDGEETADYNTETKDKGFKGRWFDY